MSTGRKSQLEKFEAKQAKARAIEHEIAEKKAREAQAERTKDSLRIGRDIVKEKGKNPEDVYAVLTYDFVSSLIDAKKSNQHDINEAVRDVIQDTVREVVRDIIREELSVAVKGVFAGLNKAMVEQNQPEEIADDLPKHPRLREFALAKREGRLHVKKPVSSESKSLEIKDHEKVDSIPRTGKGINWDYIIQNDMVKDVMFKLLAIGEDEGVKIEIGSRFKTHGTDFNGAYQRYMIINKGIKGAWKSLVEEYQEAKVNQ